MAQQADKISKTPVIHQLQHAAQNYRIITSNEDIIQRNGEQIVRACQLQISVSTWWQNFDLAVGRVAQWCGERAEKLALALVDLRSDKVVFYVIPAGDAFDFELGEQQADLDIELNTRGGIGYVETRQVPAWELERFVASDAYLVWPKAP
jgi:hypothetical protein